MLLDFKRLRAEVLPCYGRDRLYQLIRKGVIPCIRVAGGRKLVFDPVAVVAALKQHESGGKAA